MPVKGMLIMATPQVYSVVTQIHRFRALIVPYLRFSTPFSAVEVVPPGVSLDYIAELRERKAHKRKKGDLGSENTGMSEHRLKTGGRGCS